MKNLKRVLALVIALVFVMGTVAFADTTAATEEPAAYTKAQDLLGQLEIMVGDENGNFNADKTITKGEAARIIYSLMVEMGGTLPGVDTVFSDVTSLYWGSGYINALNGATVNGAAVINGTGNGTFAPTKTLSYDEINTMLSIVLGYQPYAVKQGGYPFGYRSAASKAKLYDNTFGAVTYGGTKGITRGEVAILVANALIAETMIPTSFSDNGTTIFDFSGEIFAEANCGLDVVAGVVRSGADKTYTVGTATGLTTELANINDAIGLNAMAFLGGKSYKTIEALAVLGERASIATGTDASKFKFTPPTVVNSEVKLGTVSVDDGKNTYKVADGVKLSVNGTALDATKFATAVANLKNNSTDKIVLYGENNVVNEIVVEFFSAGKVEAVYKSTNNVKVNVEGTASLYTVKKDNSTFTKADGEAGTVADMTVGSFVKVTPIVKADGTAAACNFTVAETKLEDVKATKKTAKDVFTIDGKEYSKNANLFKSETPLDEIVGTVGTFTLDVNNKVVSFVAATEASNEYLGYVTFVQLYNSGRNAGKVTFDIVIDGKKLSYTTTDVSGDGKVADKIKGLDGTNKKDSDAIDPKLLAYVKLDKNDNVTDFALATEATKADQNYTFDAALDKLTNTKTATDKIYLSDSSKVYTIAKGGKIVEKELSFLTDKGTYNGVIEIENFAGNKVVGIMIVGSAESTVANTAMVVRDYMTESIDGTRYTTVEILVHGEEEPILLKTETSELNGMVKGDYITYTLDGDGNVATADVLAKYHVSNIKYDAEEVLIDIPDNDKDFDGTKDGYALIAAKSGVTVTYYASQISSGTTKANMDKYVLNPNGTNKFDVSDNLKIYVYDVTNGTVVSSTVGDDLIASEFVYGKDDKITAAYYTAMFVNVEEVNGNDEIVEIVVYTGLKDNFTK